MAHTCRYCDRDFETLSQYRLHDCDAERKKEAERIRFDQFAQLESGPPVACFTVELERGADTGGKFDMAFAAVSGDEGDPQFAFIDKKNQPIVRLEYDEEVEQFLTQCLETGEYVTAINYENTEYVDEFGREGFLVTGRALGRMFDVTQREELPASMLETIQDIQRTLDGERQERGSVQLEDHSDEAALPPLVDTTPGEHVLELGVIGGDEPRVVRDLEGFGGEFSRLIITADIPNQSPRSVQVEPLPDAPAARYLRIGFAGDEAAETVANFASRCIDSRQVNIAELLGEDMAQALRDAR